MCVWGPQLCAVLDLGSFTANSRACLCVPPAGELLCADCVWVYACGVCGWVCMCRDTGLECIHLDMFGPEYLIECVYVRSCV